MKKFSPVRFPETRLLFWHKYMENSKIYVKYTFSKINVLVLLVFDYRLIVLIAHGNNKTLWS